MAATSEYTDEQKAGFVKLALAEGRAAAAKKSGKSEGTISLWAKARGVNLTTGKVTPKKKPKRRAAARSNGKANGHARTPRNGSTRAAMASVREQVEAALAMNQQALHSLDVVQKAFRQVFG